MVERHVYLKIHDEHIPRRDDIAAACEQRLPDVPGVRAAHALVPADDASARSWDLCLRVLFDDIAAVETYLPHPAHRAFVDEVLVPVVSFKKAWNFTLP